MLVQLLVLSAELVLLGGVRCPQPVLLPRLLEFVPLCVDLSVVSQLHGVIGRAGFVSMVLRVA